MATSQTPPRTHTPSNKALGWVLGFGLIAIAAVTVIYSSLSGFAEYDDEGYVMIGLRLVSEGHKLYDQVYSQYGPFYYLLQGGLYGLLHLRVTNDAVRAIMASVWLLGAGLCSWATYRLVRSWLFAVLSFTAAIKILGFFVGSPGHPEEICVVLLLGVLLCACYVGEGYGSVASVVLGCLIGALIMTKINIGAYAAIAVAMAFVKAAPVVARLRNALFGFLSFAGFCLPMVVLAPLRNMHWAQRTLLLVVVSMGAAFLTALFSETEQFVSRTLWVKSGLACIATVLLVAGAFLAKGTTFAAMLYATLLQYRSFSRNWYIPFRVGSELIPLASLILAIVWVVYGRSKARRPMITALNVLKLLVSIAWCFELRTGAWPIVYNVTIPFTWLLLVPAKRGDSSKAPFARLALSLLTVLIALYMLPVAGAQIAFSVVLTIPMICIFLDDVRNALAGLPNCVAIIRIAEVAVLALAIATNIFWARSSYYRYRSLRPFRLPGAERIHTGAGQASTYQWIAATLKESCDSSFSMPGIFSAYFWTQTGPPTMLLLTDWMGLFTRGQQEQVIKDLSRFPRLCVVYNPRLVSMFWRGQDLTASPLARYIHDNFAPIDQRGDYYILARKGQVEPKREFHGDVVVLSR